MGVYRKLWEWMRQWLETLGVVFSGGVGVAQKCQRGAESLRGWGFSSRKSLRRVPENDHGWTLGSFLRFIVVRTAAKSCAPSCKRLRRLSGSSDRRSRPGEFEQQHVSSSDMSLEPVASVLKRPPEGEEEVLWCRKAGV